MASRSSGVPNTAAIVLVNLSVTAADADGMIIAFPAGTAAPATQHLAFTSGRPQAALSAVRVNSAGHMTILNNSPVPVTVAVDVLGYFRAGFPAVAAAFTKAAPATLFTSGAAAESVVTSTAAGEAGVPAKGVTAVVIQLSASGSKGAGNLTGYAAGAYRPSTPHVTFTPGQTSVNMVIVPVSATGSISVYNSAPTGVTVRADLDGYILNTSLSD